MRSIFFLFILAAFTTAWSQAPAGGTMLNAETGTTYIKIGNCTLTEEAVTGQDFTTALRVQNGTGISNAWDAQLKFPTVAGVAEDDVVLVAFYARTISSGAETGEGRVTVCIEQSVTYAKQLYYNISIGQEWKEYYAPVQIVSTLATSETSYLFHMGFPDQTVEVADVRYLNYYNTKTLEDMPITEITYVGQAPDATWRAPAEERIQQIRKGQVDITVYDTDGALLENADLHIEMVKHQFGFGTAVAASELNSNEMYRNTVLDMFNEVVFENDLKWPQFQWTHTHAGINQAFDTLEAHGLAIRGHNIIWPSYRFMPDFVEDLANDPEGMRKAIDEHIDDVTTFTAGRLVDWDVINEPYSEHDVMDLLGDEVMADWFKRTQENDRGVKRYLNDYSIINRGGNNTEKQDYFYNLVQEIDMLGGGVDGIGIQGHFGSELTSISKIYEILDRFAALGKDIKITEHDIDLDQRGVQADYTRDFMTILFSHASVKSLLVWGFWEGRHWKPEGAFFDEDWTIRPHGEVWNDMIKNQWWTMPVDLLSDDQGQADFEGFLGSYSYTVSDGTTERSGTFTMDNSFQSGLDNHIVISLDEAVPEYISIIPDKQAYLCLGEEVSLSAPEGEGLSYEWTLDNVVLSEQSATLLSGVAGSYRVTVSKNGISRSSEPYLLEVRTLPEASMDSDGSLSFCVGETVSFLATGAGEADLDWYKDNKRFQWGGSEMETGESGNYSLKVSENGCSVVLGSFIVSVNEKVDLTIEALGELVFCEGEDLIIRTHPDPGVAYSWSRGETVVETDNFMITVTESGLYNVFLDNDGCISSSDTLEVEVLSVPEALISADGDLAICQGSSVTLTANEGEGLVYAWMRDGGQLGLSTRSIAASEAGSYMLIVANEACSTTSDAVEVSLRDASDPVCATGMDTDLLDVRLYPNPFHGNLQIELAGPVRERSMLELFDAIGNLKIQKLLEPGISALTLSVDEPGLYMLRISTGTFTQSYKVINQ